MTVSLFVVTYRKDAEFFGYLAKSYIKFVRGFSEFVVACPHEDVALFKTLGAEIPNYRVVGYKENYEKGHLKHQVENDKAEQYCKGDFVCHIDSDCLFTDYCCAEDFFVDGKSVIWMEKYENFRESCAIRYKWRSCVTRSLGIEPEYEYMSCLPITYPRDFYPIYRQAVEAHTGMEFEAHVLSGRATFPYDYADYPAMGVLAHKIMPERFYWRDADSRPKANCWFVQHKGKRFRQFWSHGGVTPECKAEIDRVLSQP